MRAPQSPAGIHGVDGEALARVHRLGIAENGKPCSAYYQSLDTTKIATDGFSCSGVMAMGTIVRVASTNDQRAEAGLSRQTNSDAGGLYRAASCPAATPRIRLRLAVGRRIRKLREEAGLTMEKLAFESDLLSKGHLSSTEKGLVMPTVATLAAIAERLDVSVVDQVNEPEASERQKLIELSRSLPPGTLRKLVRELSSAGKRGDR